MKWTKEEVFKVACHNINNGGSIFAPHTEACPLCREAGKTLALRVDCDDCSLWKLYDKPKPHFRQLCLGIEYKERFLYRRDDDLDGNKPALKALARAVFLNSGQT